MQFIGLPVEVFKTPASERMGLLRQIVFQPKQEKIKSKIYGEVEAVRLEAVTSFASFENKEGVIRIWYTNDRKKTPILIELDLPIGSVRFELDEIKEG